VSQIHVLVATTRRDLKAEVIFAAVARCTDMTLVCDRVVLASDVEAVLVELPPFAACALVLVGPPAGTDEIASRWLAQRKRLVVLRVDIVEDVVQIVARQVGMDSLLAALRSLVGRDGLSNDERVLRFKLVGPPTLVTDPSDRVPPSDALPRQPIQDAVTRWLHATFRAAVGRLSGSESDLPGLSVAASTVSALLDSRPARAGHEPNPDTAAAEIALRDALEQADPSVEPLATVASRLDLAPLEFKLLALTLAPELDQRYQRCIGLLLDDMGRRVGTLGLYAELLGEPSSVRYMLACSGALTRWNLIERSTPGLPAADEPLRVDPALRDWLLGQTDALENDPLVQRVVIRSPWIGANLLEAASAHSDADELFGRLHDGMARWLVLGGDSAPTWRGLVELGARGGIEPVRVDLARFVGLAPAEIIECGHRLARLARLGSRPLVVDAGSLSDEASQGDDVCLAFDSMGAAGLPAALIANDIAVVVRWLADSPYELLVASQPFDGIEGVRCAAAAADAYLTPESAQRITSQYPLRIDGLEQAVRLALTMPLPHDTDEPRATRFETACRDVSAAGLSRLAERIEPVFDLNDVVLPDDRREQLVEIVDNVRLSTKVLDDWKFRRQLPYGRGVAALFHGPSGTGKTMAALAVARRLGVQILRVDLSRIVSKYIGDTEKNIDRVFVDARTSGAALLIDEADALLGKRSEVKDAHDRYANIEVAYLLQRMEAHEGLAILTTNLRQNLDHAFVRRLRFVVDFPRPDAQAREQIWRRCLPSESHALDDTAFRQLGRRMELTGGHIRQITLRAAFMAAAKGVPIALDHLAAAARAEFAKLGMPPVELDIAESRRAA
jgi:hypothetical protein